MGNPEICDNAAFNFGMSRLATDLTTREEGRNPPRAFVSMAHQLDENMVDSGSADRTCEIAHHHSVRVHPGLDYICRPRNASAPPTRTDP